MFNCTTKTNFDLYSPFIYWGKPVFDSDCSSTLLIKIIEVKERRKRKK